MDDDSIQSSLPTNSTPEKAASSKWCTQPNLVRDLQKNKTNKFKEAETFKHISGDLWPPKQNKYKYEDVHSKQDWGAIMGP